MTYRELAKKGAGILVSAGIDNALNEAESLLCFLLKYSKTDFLLHRGAEADEKTEANYLLLIGKRVDRVPLQYIISSAPFLGTDFEVGSGVLIPRPETEQLTQICIDMIRSNGYRNVIDLCSGSGCIGISIAMHCPQTEVWLLEKYADAIAYLKKNIPNSIASRVHTAQADILTCDPADFPLPDLIVSNPPYIASGEIASLQKEVQAEPITALDGGADGLIFYRNIASRWAARLCAGGCLALECGETQTETIAQMLPSAVRKEIVSDIFGLRRFVIAYF